MRRDIGIVLASQKILGMILLLCGSTLLTAAEEEPGGIRSEDMSQRLQSFGPSLSAMGREGERLWAWAEAAKNCDSLKMAAFLLMVSANRLGDSTLPDKVHSLETEHNCQITSSALSYAFGVNGALSGDWVQANHWFRRSVALAQDEPIRYLQNALNALAVTQMRMQQHQKAIVTLEALHGLDQTAFPIESMNTLAYANFLVGNCMNALEWCDLGRERIRELANNPEVLPAAYESALVGLLLTEMEVGLVTEDHPRVETAFDQINFDGAFDQREINAVGTLTLYFQWANLPDLALVFRNRLQQWTAGIEPAVLEDHLGVNSSLFGAADSLSDLQWQQQLVRLSSLPLHLRGLPRTACAQPDTPDTRDNLANAHAQLHRWKGWATAAGLLLLPFSWMTAVAWRQMRRLSRCSAFSEEELLAILEQQAGKPASARSVFPKNRLAYKAFAELSSRHFPELNSDLASIMAEWPEGERIVALALAKGETSKSIAIRENLNMSRVYSIRRSIRKKLNLSSQVALDDWLKSRMNT